MTEKVYEELDHAKAEIETLKSENLVKANLCENLKRLNNDQLKRIQELNLKLDKQAQEIGAKADEVYAAKQSLEDLKSKLREKEKIIVNFTSANDKLRADLNSKLQECEAEKQMLVSSLEEANTKILNLEDQNRAFMDKIEVLKEGIVSVSQKKCASESKMAKASKQMRERGDMFEKLEEEKAKLEEQIKWKNEQFKHLEEAHEKLRNNIRVKEKEWDIEKRTFFDDISTLETKLDSQITVSEDLKRRLELCKQAVAHEEDRRKCLEIQLSDSNSCFVDTKSKLDSLIIEKESVCKEMDRKIREMEDENQELVLSLKKLKESQIQEASNSSSIIKLQNKIKTLEEINNVKEGEWTSQIEKMVAELNCCRRDLESKETRLKEITAEVDDYHSLVLQLTMEKEESAVMMVALKSILSETRSKIDEEKQLLHTQIESYEDQLAQTKSELMNEKLLLHKQIESYEDQLAQTKSELMNEKLLLCKQVESYEDQLAQTKSKLTNEKLLLCKQIESYEDQLAQMKNELMNEKLLLHKRIESYEDQIMQTKSELMNVREQKEITTEVDGYKSTLLETQSTIDEEKLMLRKQLESYEDQLVQTKSDLMEVNEELDQTYCEVNEAEFELQIWKSVAEKLEADLEVNKRMRRELEASLLAQVATEVNLKEDLKQKETRITDLEQDIKDLKDEWVAKELEAAILAQLESERIHECEKQNLNQLVEQKDQRINNLQQVMSSLEREFHDSTASFSAKLAKMQAEMNLFHEAWEKMRTTMVLKEIEVQEKGLMIIELEKDLETQVRFAKKCMSRVKKLSLENQKLMSIIDGASDWINKLSREEGQMMGALRSIVSSFDENRAGGNASSELSDRFDPVKENMKNMYESSPKRNMVDNSVDERSPLRTRNG